MTGSRRVRLRLHAALRDAAGIQTIELVVPSDSTPRAVYQLATTPHPALAAWRDLVAFGSDDRLLPGNSPLPAEVEVLHALPPVSGG